MQYEVVMAFHSDVLSKYTTMAMTAVRLLCLLNV